MIKEKINKILEEQLKSKPSEEVLKKIKKIAKEFSSELKKKLAEKKIKADVFIGGSLAKSTLVKKNVYDIDIFVRFEGYEDKKISHILGKVVAFSKFKSIKKIHGSRDYYQLRITEPLTAFKKNLQIFIEVVPVLKIKRPEDAKNVTDLSYFHVNYILKKLRKNKKLIDEIILAKSFAYAQNAYGAESYIQGFSGYALELLILHYGSFLNFIKEIAKTKDVKKNKIIIDDENYYKGKVLEKMNKSKLSGPLVIIDPTFKERNASSSLSLDTFLRFREACKKFLKNPSNKFFEKKSVSLEFKKYKNVKIVKVKTNKQAGDIAGTKSKKFFDFFIYKLKKEFRIKKSAFEYDEEKNLAKFYFVLEKKKKEIIKGPPVTSLFHLKNFKKHHSNTFIKKGFVYAYLSHDLLFEEWLSEFLKKEKSVIKEMGIKEVKLEKLINFI